MLYLFGQELQALKMILFTYPYKDLIYLLIAASDWL